MTQVAPQWLYLLKSLFVCLVSTKRISVNYNVHQILFAWLTLTTPDVQLHLRHVHVNSDTTSVLREFCVSTMFSDLCVHPVISLTTVPSLLVILLVLEDAATVWQDIKEMMAQLYVHRENTVINCWIFISLILVSLAVIIVLLCQLKRASVHYNTINLKMH